MMPRTDLHIKVQIEHDESEDTEKIASDICRQLLKIYGVRLAEVSNIVTEN